MRYRSLLAVSALSFLVACGAGGGAGNAYLLPNGERVVIKGKDPIPRLAETPDGPMGYGDFGVVFNEVRGENGLGTLQENAKLNKASRDYARQMQRDGHFAHVGLDGSTPGSRARAAGYDWTVIRENLARGLPTNQSVVDAWMGSPGHYETMVDPRVEDFGLGRHSDYWVLMVGVER